MESLSCVSPPPKVLDEMKEMGPQELDDFLWLVRFESAIMKGVTDKLGRELTADEREKFSDIFVSEFKGGNIRERPLRRAVVKRFFRVH